MFDAWIHKTYRDLGLLFLLFFVVLGTSYAFLLPPFLVPDERRHWLAAHHHLAKLATGNGTVCSTDVALDRHFMKMRVKFRPGRKVPSDIFSRVKKLTPECEERLLYKGGNPLSYPGVLLSRLFVPREPDSGTQSLYAFYCARLLHGLLIALLLFRLWWLARTSASTGPAGMLTLLLFSLSPLFVQQSFGITIDVVSNAFALALCVWMVFSDRLAWFDYVTLLALGSITVLGRPVLLAVLPPMMALGFYLGRVRRNPGGATSLTGTIREEFARRKQLVAVVLVIMVAGAIYTLINAPAWAKGSDIVAHLEFLIAHPSHGFQTIGGRLANLFLHPSFFLDYLGYLDTRLSSATLRDFGALAVLVAIIEAIGIWRGIARLVRDHARRREILPVLRTVAVLATLAFAAIGLSILLIGFLAYTWSPLTTQRLPNLQPRYLFPHLVVTVGVGMAIARTLLGPLGEPTPRPSKGARRAWHFAEVALVCLFAAGLLSFISHLSIDILARYS